MHYKVIDGTSFDEATSRVVADIVNQLIDSQERVRIFYGHDGVDWFEENGTIGYISRSCGTNKVPILVYNKRALGGGHILDHCIVKIVATKGGRIIWQHPNYVAPITRVVDSKEPGYIATVLVNDELYANCKTEKEAHRLADFLSGKMVLK